MPEISEIYITRWLPGCARVPYYAPGQCPHHDTSLDVFLPPLLPFSLPSSLNPSSARFLPPCFPRAIHASLVPFSNLPRPSLPPLTLSPCLSSSLPPSLPSLPRSLAPSLPPTLVFPCSHPPSFLAPYLPPSIAAASVTYVACCYLQRTHPHNETVFGE